MSTSIENDLVHVELSLKEGNYDQILNSHLNSLFTIWNNESLDTILSQCYILSRIFTNMNEIQDWLIKRSLHNFVESSTNLTISYIYKSNSNLIAYTAQRSLESICKSYILVDKLNMQSVYEKVYDQLFSFIYNPSYVHYNITLSIISNLLRDFRKLLKSNNDQLSSDAKNNIVYSCDNFITNRIELCIPFFVDKLLNNTFNDRHDSKIYFMRLTIQLLKYFKETKKKRSDILNQFISKYIRNVTYEVFKVKATDNDVNSVLLLQKTLFDLLTLGYDIWDENYIYYIQFLNLFNEISLDILMKKSDSEGPFHIDPVYVKRTFILCSLRMIELVLNKMNRYWNIQKDQQNIYFSSKDIYHTCSNLSVDHMYWKSNEVMNYRDESEIGYSIISVISQVANHILNSRDIINMETLLEIFIEQDDQLIDLLYLLQIIHQHFFKGEYILFNYFETFNKEFLSYLNSLINPHIIFYYFLKKIHFDYSVLLDFLVSNETDFLLYFLTYLKICNTSFHQMVSSLQSIESQIDDERVLHFQETIDKNLHLALEKLNSLELNSDSESSFNLIEGYDFIEEDEEIEDYSTPLEKVMTVIIQLRIRLTNADKKKLLPYNSAPLLKHLNNLESLYEEM